MPISLESFVATLKLIPRGVRLLFRDSKAVISAKLSKEPMTRRNHDLARRTAEAWKKVGLFLVIQAPPVIGMIPILAAVAYPRQLLTHHFWSDDQRQEFLMEEYQERRGAANAYFAALASPHAPLSLSSWLEIVNATPRLEINTGLPNVYLLLHSHALINTNWVRKALPTFLLTRLLKRRAQELAKDDVLLLQEGIDDLSLSELQQAALERGIDPLLPRDELAVQLEVWLARQRDTPQLFEQVAKEELSPQASSAMAHLVAAKLYSPSELRA